MTWQELGQIYDLYIIEEHSLIIFLQVRRIAQFFR